MSKLVVLCYLVGGYHVGDIARDMDMERSDVRATLKDWGITLRPDANGYSLGRDPVCDAVKRTGYYSFHRFARAKGLDPITEQAAELGVSEKSLSRVYNAYRKLLEALKAAGVVLPTSQMSGANLEPESESS